MENKKKIVIVAGKEETDRSDVLDVLRCQVSVEQALKANGWNVENFYLTKTSFRYRERVRSGITALQPFCVFNLFEGFGGQAELEIELVRILEEIKVPFTGSSFCALEACLNKTEMKRLLSGSNIPVPEGIFVRDSAEIDIKGMNVPLFVKPCFEDASVGIDTDSLVVREQDLRTVLEKKLGAFPSGVIVEKFIPGKEYNAALIGNYPYEIVGVSMIDYNGIKDINPFLTYSSKWETGSRDYRKTTSVVLSSGEGEIKDKIADIARSSGKALGCRGYFRVDIREHERKFFVIDVNPNPDINEDSGFMRQAYAAGYTYKDMIEKIVSFTGCAG